MVGHEEVNPPGRAGSGKRVEVEIVSSGRELLIGRTVNTNASWIASRLTRIGASVTRVTTVGDTVREIASAIRESISRRPSAVIVTGGLGPTYDDLTAEALASALMVPKALNEEAYRMVYEKYAAMGLPMTPPRLKMACLPEGSKPIRNESGTAPGITATSEGVMIFCLPGVPKEMMSMFDSSVLPAISRLTGSFFGERGFVVEGLAESTLASIIDDVKPSHPEVYFKSHPEGSESVPVIEMHLTASSCDLKRLEDILASAEDDFIKAAEKRGGTVRRGSI
ncbi:MAG: molybdopterin-binding protein [Candidatus Verstraetearchaeota archaeon]|nr:molybdopterin-binding protein [Candidatus Verstraetearchaeota archaeon]